MSEYQERAVTQYLIDPEIRSILKPHLAPWMFQKEMNREFAKVVLTSDFDGRPATSNLVKMCLGGAKNNKKFKVEVEEGLELITIRYYDAATIERVSKNKDVILQQKGKRTIQLVVKDLGKGITI